MLAGNLRTVQQKIAAALERAGRLEEKVRLVAVTKTVGAEQIREAVALGLQDFGENRVQEARPKLQLFPDLHWHFIGHLQSNKVRDALTGFKLIHSLDRFSLARALQRRAERLDVEARCLLQLNISGEKNKFGLTVEELPDFLTAMSDFPRIRVEGLMTMAPFSDDPEEARPIFRRLNELRQIHSRPGKELRELSMGMTGDYIVAVEEGATMVRIGSALFGPRPGGAQTGPAENVGDIVVGQNEPVGKAAKITGTVATLRLDAVLALGFNLSRSRAVLLIKGGRVQVNGRLVDTPAYRLKQDDQLSLEGRGRLELAALTGKSRKGRQRIKLYKIV